MNRFASFSSLSLGVAMLCLAAGLPHAQAATPAPGTVDLITTPPELTAKVAPNVVLTFDDSGSMTWRHMPDQRPYVNNVNWASGISKSAGQNEATNSSYPVGTGNAYWLCAGVIDPRVTPDPNNPKSWSMNGVYYNPRTTYRRPIKADGTLFPMPSYTAVWRNGITANYPTVNASATKFDFSTNTTAQGKRFCGNTPGYYRLKSSVALTLGADGKLTTASTNALYNSNSWEWVALPTAQQQNFAIWYAYYHTRVLAAISATSLAYADFDKSIRVAWQNINASTTDNPFVAKNTTVMNPFEGTTRTKFYDWLLKSPATGGTPNQAAAKRVGELFTGGAGLNNTRNPYWDQDTSRELSCRKNFHIQMTDGLWNGSVATVTNRDTSAKALPDGRAYSAAEAESKIFWNEGSSAQNTMADIAFHYWATDLRPDFQHNSQTKLKVRPYLADPTTGITGTTPWAPGTDWRDNKELYWNPANNPASWPHLVQYMIGFGVDGTIPKTPANLERLRKGLVAWPKLDPQDLGPPIVDIPYYDNAKKIDDMWHAAINSRGEFFAAANPDELIAAMQKIIASVVAQSSSSTPATVALPILTGDNDSAFQGGYDTTGWPGNVRRYKLNNQGDIDEALWDASCKLTGGDCAEPAATGLSPRNPSTRLIVTSNNGLGGLPFRYSSLSSTQQAAMNADGAGTDRVDYLRGVRTNEAAGASPLFRKRQSVMGAIVNGELTYISSPRSGYHDIFPAGSPEAVAGPTNSYAAYQNAQRSRQPMVYAASNDGMLHALNADTGEENWAFVPDTLIRNGRMAAMTGTGADLVPGVDSRPRERDVFFGNKWRTVLVGSLRLGGRGVYALDVTNPVASSESDAANKVLWEFTSGTAASSAGDPPCAAGARYCASLGYTYDSANIMRIPYQDKWVAVVSSGYFPDSTAAAAKAGDIEEAAASRTSLLVIDLETGKLIREIRTSAAPQTFPSGFKTFGLSTPMVYDVGSDEVDDLVYAGDLAGNLWRFDLSDDQNPENWTVDLMFTTYGGGGASNPGDQPIVFNPTALRDPATRRPILVVGTGKYLGGADRTINIPEQAWYGIRDYGAASSYYPIMVNQLLTQKIAQDSDNVRKVTGYDNPTGTVPGAVPSMQVKSENAAGNPIVNPVRAHGWRIRLNISTEKGERAQRRAIPMVTGNIAFVYGLIPKSDDPCDPGARYSMMAVDGGTGAALGSSGTGRGVVGATTTAPAPPSDPIAIRGGSGGIVVGLPDTPPEEVEDAINEVLKLAIPPWHRGAWRELQIQ